MKTDESAMRILGPP
jgi:hypothetical protein